MEYLIDRQFQTFTETGLTHMTSSRAAAVASGAITNPSVDGMLSSPLPSAVVAVSSEVVRSFCLSTSVLAFSWPVGATSAPCGEMSSPWGYLPEMGEKRRIGGLFGT